MALGALAPDGAMWCIHGDPVAECDLCAPSARARRTDPAESHQAARRVTTSGAADRDRDLALGLVRHYPGHTVPELARRWAGPEEDVEALRQRLGRRMSELARAGLIERGFVVRDGCATWQPRYA